MVALQLATTVGWIAVCVLVALAVLVAALGIAKAFGARPSRGLVTRLAVGVGAAAVIVPVAGLVIYTQLNDDAPDEFDHDDLAELVSGGVPASTTGVLLAGFGTGLGAETADTADTADTGVPADGATECADESATAEPAPSAVAPEGALDGEWVVAEGSEFGYRIPEILAGVETEAVGRGTEIAGSFTAAGSEVTAACFVVQVASITSDESMRDGQFTGRIMETSEYPTATFVLTEPIVLDDVPEVGGDPVSAEAAGDLTLHGVTRSVTFEVVVQAGEGDGDGVLIGVLGQIPVVFSDYDIDDPSAGPAQVGDEGTLEFLLAFEQA
jgi:polyisoprenoid-binding protein YceI